MKASAGFAFFLLFLGGFALVNLRNMGEDAAATQVTAESLSQNAWRPTHIGEMRLDETTDLFVQFEADGSLSGHSGCNRFFGSFALDGAALRIDSLGMTRMACPGAVMSIEMAFIEALQAAATVLQRDARMAIRNERGETTVSFDAIERVQ